MIDATIVAAAAMALLVPLITVVTTVDPSGRSAWVGVGVLGSVLIFVGCFFGYEGLLLAKWGRTLGKRWMGLRVVSAQVPGAPLSTKVALTRAAVYPTGFILVNVLPLVSFVGLLNVLWQFWDKPFQQCLHEKMVGTMVIDDRARDGGH